MTLFTLYKVYPIQSCKCPIEPELNCTHPSKNEYHMVEIFDTQEDAELVLKALSYAKGNTLYKIKKNISATKHSTDNCYLTYSDEEQGGGYLICSYNHKSEEECLMYEKEHISG